LKKVLLLDVFVLAAFYNLRLIAGGEATGITLSFWLNGFSIFLFLSLAMIKRYAEITIVQQEGGTKARARDYQVSDRQQLAVAGTVCGCVAVVVLALYINSPEVRNLYARPGFLWPICVAVLFWVNRAWMIAHRHQMTFDPIVFAFRDVASYGVLSFVCAMLAMAIG
jgi:4-hydroxybenzoate polyprenyltransferase